MSEASADHFGFIKEIGWETDAEGNREFIARVVLPNGPDPSISYKTVWDRSPVRLEAVGEELT